MTPEFWAIVVLIVLAGVISDKLANGLRKLDVLNLSICEVGEKLDDVSALARSIEERQIAAETHGWDD